MSPKIYCFSNVVGGGEGVAYAMAEDGTILGSHWCSDEFYVRNDLGVNEGSRADRHADYAKHYPDDYEMEFVRSDELPGHEGLARALELNQKQAAAAQDESAAPTPPSDVQAAPQMVARPPGRQSGS